MAKPDDSKPEENATPTPTPLPPAAGDLENQFRIDDNSKPEENATPTPLPPDAGDLEYQIETGRDGGLTNILRRWKREDLLKRSSLVLRSVCFVFSLFAFIIMASNKHGDWKDFDRYEEYSYVLAIAILSTLYTGLQAVRQIHELSTAREILPQQKAARIDFIGDQIIAYLLISAASSAVPLTNRMREGADNIFTDSSATAISMVFFAFFSLGSSAIICGYKLCTQTYI